jgi:hypothetical protein
MKTFRIKIRAYGYFCDFTLECEDSSKALEDAIVDKLGKNDIVWEDSKFYNTSKIWLTYEELSDANTRSIPLQTEEGLRTTVGAAL